MNIKQNIQTQIHLLKHFYFISTDYKNEVKDIDSKIIEESIKTHSSKFFKSFAKNPLELVEKIKPKLLKKKLNEGRNEITVNFNEIIGFDLLINNTEKNNTFYTTRKLNIILFKEDEALNIITIFPGKFAPPLPDSETQSEQVYSIAKQFWNDYKISSFSNFEIIETKISIVLSNINKSWSLRYSNFNESLKLASEAKKLAEEINFIEGIEFASLSIISTELMRTTANEDSFKILTRQLSIFNKYKNNLAIVRTLITLSNQYDLFGMYSKALKACLKGINIAKENNYLSELSDIYSTFGFVNIRISDYKQAEIAFGKSLKIREEQSDLASVAASYNQLARASMLNKKYDKAEKYYQESIKIRQENEYWGALLWSYIGIASLYMEIKEYDKTLQYFKKIEEIKSQHNLNDKRSTIMCLHGEGQIKNNLEKYDDALKPLHESLQIAEEVGIKPIQFQVHYELYKSYSKLNNNDKA